MINRFVFITLLFFVSSSAFCQIDSLWNAKPKIVFSGFLDVFYIYDFNRPTTNERLPFVYNHNRSNEFNINLALIQIKVEHTKYRSSLGIQGGTYVNDNYAEESSAAQIFHEANIGISLNKKRSIWLDAGIFGSHIGFESDISAENWTMTRSLSAENSPYFLTGAKLSFEPSEKWQFTALVVNGWQRIQRVQGNSLLSFGTQAKYTSNKGAIVNWSTFIGTDDTDSLRRMRYFNNLYTRFKLNKNFGLVAGFDFGLQQKQKQSSMYSFWLTPTLIAHYELSKKWKMALRGELFLDDDGVIVVTQPENGFETWGISYTLGFSPNDIVLLRFESRLLTSKDALFTTKNNQFSKNNLFVGCNMSLKFR